MFFFVKNSMFWIFSQIKSLSDKLTFKSGLKLSEQFKKCKFRREVPQNVFMVNKNQSTLINQRIKCFHTGSQRTHYALFDYTDSPYWHYKCAPWIAAIFFCIFFIPEVQKRALKRFESIGMRKEARI